MRKRWILLRLWIHLCEQTLFHSRGIHLAGIPIIEYILVHLNKIGMLQLHVVLALL